MRTQATTVTIGADGMPTAVMWRDEMQPVLRILDSWHFDMDWAISDGGRKYVKVELKNRTRLHLCHNLSSEEWVIEDYQEPWYRRLFRSRDLRA